MKNVENENETFIYAEGFLVIRVIESRPRKKLEHHHLTGAHHWAPRVARSLIKILSRYRDGIPWHSSTNNNTVSMVYIIILIDDN